jgi:transposase
VPFSTIRDLDTAKQALVLIQHENERLHAKLAKQAHQIAQLLGESDTTALNVELLRLKEQMASFQQALFAPSSEKRKEDGDTGASESGATAQTSKNEDENKGKDSPTPKEKRQLNLPSVERKHELHGEDMACDSCGGQLAEWEGKFEEFEEVDVVEREYRIVQHLRQKYRCSCGCAPVTAPGPVRLRGSGFSLLFAITVCVDKWGMHLPHVRQSDKMAALGCPIADAQLYQQAELLARTLEPTYDALGDYVADSELIHADETPWRMLKKGSKKWWAWTFSNYDSIYICIDPSRGHQVPLKVLEGSKGLLVVDAHGAYKKLVTLHPGLKLALCWSHARRKLIEAEAAYPQAAKAISIIRELFAVESNLPDFRHIKDETERARALEEIQVVRNAESRPLMAKLHRWLQDQTCLPKSKLGIAIRYALNNWSGLSVFLDEARAPMTNNQAERSIRPAVIGRKNHYGSKSRRGTEVAALFYSLIGTCRMLQINPTDYLLAAATCAIETPGAVLLPHEFLAAQA